MKAADRERLARIHAMRCMACEIDGYGTQAGRTEAHHIVAQSYRKHQGGHLGTLPLCAWHHRGEPFTDWSKSRMELVYGPSLADSKRQFIARYGMERDLLAKINQRLEVA
jgi:hypothetical protein